MDSKPQHDFDYISDHESGQEGDFEAKSYVSDSNYMIQNKQTLDEFDDVDVNNQYLQTTSKKNKNSLEIKSKKNSDKSPKKTSLRFEENKDDYLRAQDDINEIDEAIKHMSARQQFKKNNVLSMSTVNTGTRNQILSDLHKDEESKKSDPKSEGPVNDSVINHRSNEESEYELRHKRTFNDNDNT